MVILLILEGAPFAAIPFRRVKDNLTLEKILHWVPRGENL